MGKQSKVQILVGDSWIPHQGSFDKGTRGIFSSGLDNVVLVVCGKIIMSGIQSAQDFP
jgi:hypothetical protein